MSDTANGPHAGLPLLSGPAPDHPDVSDDNCRRCKKGLNAIFSRRRKCNHCGYTYCQSCTDYTALMPRSASNDMFVQSGPGHDIVQVCAFCIRYLNITAKSKDQLKKESLATLKEYASAYRIPVNGVVEKDDLIDRLVSARDRGCLKPQYEEYYRAHSVAGHSEPRRGFFTRGAGTPSGPSQSQSQQRPAHQPRARTASHPNTFPRPDLAPDTPPVSRPQAQQRPSSQYSWTSPPRNPQYAPPSGPPPAARYNPPPAPPPSGIPHFTSRTGAAAQSSANLGVPNTNPNTTRQRSSSVPRHTPAATPRPTSPAPPVPTLDSLLEMSSDDISRLSIGALKTILFRNHVNAGSVLEKGDLVSKVHALIADERVERAEAIRRAEEEEREMWAMRERAAEREREERERREQQAAAAAAEMSHESSMTVDEGEQGHARASQDNEHASPPSLSPEETKSRTPPSPLGKTQAKTMAAHLERTGLCVICQDEEANIAIVDCGHLALCRACSDLVMSSTRECPLCRTRIVTEARLLRIFKS